MADFWDEKDIIESARSGNIPAFEKIISAYEKPIFGYVFRLVQDRDDAEDLTQEIFLKVYNSLSSYDISRPFKTWIFTVATNATYDLFRKKKINKELYVIDDEGEPFETIDDTQSYRVIEEAHDLGLALQKIKPAYKSILLLYYMHGLTYEEIAEAEKLPLSTVKTNLRRAKMALKEAIEKENG